MKAAGRIARLLAAISILATVGFVGGFVDRARAGQDGDKERIITVIETYRRALNGNDVGGVLKLYAEDGVFMPEYSPSSVGLAEIRKAYERVFKAIDLDVGFRIVEVEVLGDDWAFVRSTSDGTIKINASGAEVANNGKELFLLRKLANGEWKFARYAFSSNTPPQ